MFYISQSKVKSLDSTNAKHQYNYLVEVSFSPDLADAKTSFRSFSSLQNTLTLILKSDTVFSAQQIRSSLKVRFLSVF